MTFARSRMGRGWGTMPAWCLWASGAKSSHPGAMFLKDAEVHDHENSRLASLLRRFLVDHAFLHPDRRGFELNGLIDNLFDKLRTAKNIHDIDLLGHLQKRRVGLLTQALLDARVHREDAKSVALQVGGDTMARTQEI